MAVSRVPIMRRMSLSLSSFSCTSWTHCTMKLPSTPIRMKLTELPRAASRCRFGWSGWGNWANVMSIVASFPVCSSMIALSIAIWIGSWTSRHGVLQKTAPYSHARVSLNCTVYVGSSSVKLVAKWRAARIDVGSRTSSSLKSWPSLKYVMLRRSTSAGATCAMILATILATVAVASADASSELWTIARPLVHASPHHRVSHSAIGGSPSVTPLRSSNVALL